MTNYSVTKIIYPQFLLMIRILFIIGVKLLPITIGAQERELGMILML